MKWARLKTPTPSKRQGQGGKPARGRTSKFAEQPRRKGKPKIVGPARRNLLVTDQDRYPRRKYAMTTQLRDKRNAHTIVHAHTSVAQAKETARAPNALIVLNIDMFPRWRGGVILIAYALLSPKRSRKERNPPPLLSGNGSINRYHHRPLWDGGFADLHATRADRRAHFLDDEKSHTTSNLRSWYASYSIQFLL